VSFTARCVSFARNVLPLSAMTDILDSALRGLNLMKPAGFICLCLGWLAACTLTPVLQANNRLAVRAIFGAAPDPTTVESMEQEASRIFADAGIAFSWTNATGQIPYAPGDLPVWVRFLGNCRLEPGRISTPTDGPMARVFERDGNIAPFVEVDCGRTAAMVWQIRGTNSLPLVVRAFGRALGRVVAHELYHYVTQSAHHGASDLFRKSMKSRDLMLPDVRFEQAEADALRRGIARLRGTAGCRHSGTE
jgi:hypothetical protein